MASEMFWEKKKKKKPSGIFWSFSAALLGALFLAPPGSWDSLLFRLGLSRNSVSMGSFDSLRPSKTWTLTPPMNRPSSLGFISGDYLGLKGVRWEQKVGAPQSVLALINPEDASREANAVSLKDNFFPASSGGYPVDEDLLSEALSQGASPGRVSAVFARKAGLRQRRARTSDFTQTFKSRSKGCFDGPNCALMQLAHAKAQSSGLCLGDGCSSSVEYQSAQLASIFDGTNGVYRRLMIAHWSESASGEFSPPTVHRLGVPLF